MTRDEIIGMARGQGFPETSTEGVFRVNTDDLGRMLAAEREACAKVCIEVGATKANSDDGLDIADLCAAAITARGEK